MRSVVKVLFIYFTFFIGFVVSTIPWDSDYLFLRPYWILALLLIWSIRAPKVVGYITALIVGILYDSTTGTQLGEHAIAFIFLTFLNRRLSRTYIQYGKLYHFLVVLALLAVYSLIIEILQLFSYNGLNFNLEFFIPILTSAIIWGWLDVIIATTLQWLAKKFR